MKVVNMSANSNCFDRPYNHSRIVEEVQRQLRTYLGTFEPSVPSMCNDLPFPLLYFSCQLGH